MSTGSALWYFSRGSGVVSVVMLSLAMVLGLLIRNKKPLPGLPKFVVPNLHRNVALLSVAFLIFHIATAVLDSYVAIDWVDVFVPFLSVYKPLWLGLGAVSIDLVLAVVITSLVRKHMSRQIWRAVHWLVFTAWPIAVLHGLTMGPDITSGLLLGLTVLCTAAVVAAAFFRYRKTRPVPRQLAQAQRTVPHAPGARRESVPTQSTTGHPR